MYRWLSPVVFDRFSPFYVPDSGAGGGGGAQNDDDDDDDLDDPPAPTATGNAAIDGVIRDHFERTRSWMKSQRRKVARYRTRATTAESELVTLRSANEQQPKVSKDELDALAAYKALGPVDEIKTKLSAGEAAQTEIVTFKRDASIRTAAEVAGYNFDVLRDRISNQELLVREVDENGQKVKKAFIKVDNNERPLTEYASEHWSVYLPALVVSGDAGNRGNGSQQQFPGQGPARNNGANNANRTGVQVVSAYTRNTYSGPPKRG